MMCNAPAETGHARCRHLPIHKPVAREKRIGLNVDMDLTNVTRSYFDSKPELKDRKEDLIKKTMQLVEENQNQETEGEL